MGNSIGGPLPFDGMIRNVHRWFGWLAIGLGLLLASQLAQAGLPCISGSDSNATCALAAAADPCTMPAGANDLCEANARRIVADTMARPPSRILSLSGVPGRCAVVVVHALAERASFSGPAPGYRVPLHALLHRYLI